MAEATVTVPTISCPSTTQPSQFSLWVGLDGFSNDSTVEQDGIRANCDEQPNNCTQGQANCTDSIQPDYYTWLEMYPGPVLRSSVPIQPGDHVAVTYEMPGGKPSAREIALTSIVFTGTLTAIDLGEKTVKASALFGSLKFNVADDCVIVINGKTDGQLSDLKPNDKLVFNYDEINGINVVDRIAPATAEAPRNPPLVTSSPMGNSPGY